MRKKFSLITFLMLSLHFYTNSANKVQWALTDIPQGYYYQDFHDGMAVCIDTITKRYGAIDSNGDLFISAQYEYLSDFNGDFAIARNVDGDGIIDKEGKYILKPQKYYQITPIEAEVEHIKQKMSNCFLVVNNKDQNQAIFYKDSFITDFTPKHSIELDIKFPFIYTKTGMILNTESGEFVNSLHDMGSYYLTLNEQGELNAISHITGENITSSVIGKYIAYDEAVNYVSSTAGSFVNDAATEAIKASMNETIDKYYCDLSYKDGEWLLATKDGDVKYSLKDKDGWVCRMPFFQNCIIWFERNIPNTDSTQLKIINITGVEICNKKVKGTFTLKFFPKYWHYMGNTMITYSSPHLFITELSSEGKIQKTTLDCIVRGDVFAQSRAMKAGKYSSYTFHDKNFYVFGNFLIHKDGDSKTIIYDIQKDKQIPVTEIINISEDIIFAKDLQGKKITIQTHESKTYSLAKIPTVNPFSENIAIADINGVKTVINAQGKTLMQDGKGLKLLGSKSSENAILALNPTNNKVGFVYNPLATDTLLFNFRKKGEQLYTIGIKFFNRKKYSQAKKCFESLLRHNPKDIKALIKYADCLTAQKYYAKAIYNYNKVLAIDSSNQDAQIKLHMAQKKKEQAEYTMALLQDIAGAAYNILDATNQALSSSQSSSESTNSSYTGKSNSHSSSTTGSTNRNDSNWRFSMMNTYADFENQLSKMNTYPETYNDNDRRYIQSRMKEIRSQLEKRGYSQRKSEWEDWDGKKK